MNKKAVLQFYLLFVFLFAMIFALSTFTEGNFEPLKASIGEKQARLMNAYQEGENLLFYVDQSAKYSSLAAIYALAENAGFYGTNCKENGYYVYSIKCNPEANLNKSFLNYFNDSFNAMIEDYPVKIHNEYSYTLDLENSKVAGKSTKPVDFKVDEGISYSIQPDFSYDTSYNFRDYSLIYGEVKEKINCLREKDDCFDKSNGFQWNIKRENNLIKFKVVTMQQVYDVNDRFIKKPVMISFAVNLDHFDR